MEHRHSEDREAARRLAAADPRERRAALLGLADCFEGAGPIVQMMNARDVTAAAEPRRAALSLRAEDIQGLIDELRRVADAPRGERGEEIVVFRAGSRHLEAMRVFAVACAAGSACLVSALRDAPETTTTLRKFVHAVLEGHGLGAGAYRVLGADEELPAGARVVRGSDVEGEGEPLAEFVRVRAAGDMLGETPAATSEQG